MSILKTLASTKILMAFCAALMLGSGIVLPGRRQQSSLKAQDLADYDFFFQTLRRSAYYNMTTRQETALEPPFTVVSESLSPNGEYLLVKRDDDLCLLTKEWAEVFCLSRDLNVLAASRIFWTSDSRQFWFRSTNAQKQNSIWLVDVPSEQLVKMIPYEAIFPGFESIEIPYLLHITPSNGIAAFSNPYAEGLYIVDLHAEEITQTLAIEYDPVAFSPDGQSLAIFRKCSGRGCFHELGILDLNKGQENSIAINIDGESAMPLSEPTWSPDGSQIAFIAAKSQTDPIVTVRYDFQSQQFDILASTKQEGWFELLWSPDGAALAQVICRAADCELAIIDKDRSKVMLMDSSAEAVIGYSWLPKDWLQPANSDH